VSATRIEWATHVYDAFTGCDRVSAGCAHCYAIPTAAANQRKELGLARRARELDKPAPRRRYFTHERAPGRRRRPARDPCRDGSLAERRDASRASVEARRDRTAMLALRPDMGRPRRPQLLPGAPRRDRRVRLPPARLARGPRRRGPRSCRRDASARTCDTDRRRRRGPARRIAAVASHISGIPAGRISGIPGTALRLVRRADPRSERRWAAYPRRRRDVRRHLPKAPPPLSTRRPQSRPTPSGAIDAGRVPSCRRAGALSATPTRPTPAARATTTSTRRSITASSSPGSWPSSLTVGRCRRRPRRCATCSASAHLAPASVRGAGACA
jgi:Protein of unknown function (DUF5131)